MQQSVSLENARIIAEVHQSTVKISQTKITGLYYIHYTNTR